MDSLKCPRCGAEIAAKGKGRPPVYCGPTCRRDAEYELRRVQSHLVYAERARLREVMETVGNSYRQRYVDAWGVEITALQERLRALLVHHNDDATLRST